MRWWRGLAAVPPVGPFESAARGAAKQRIRQAFEQAASTYDAAADVQREVCDRLGAYLLACDLPLSP